MSDSRIIGLLGGTFDPVHNGHIHIATEALANTPIAQIYFVPNHMPPHKHTAHASTSDRMAMLTLATEDHENMDASTIELDRPPPSYTLTTLAAWKKSRPSDTVVFIIGDDALPHLDQWHKAHQLLDYCHLLICDRQQKHMTDEINANPLLKDRQSHALSDMTKLTSGRVFTLSNSIIPISSSSIRAHYQHDKQASSNDLPREVHTYIKQHGLYTQK